MHYTSGRIVVQALAGAAVEAREVEAREIDAVLADTSGLAYHPASEALPAGGAGDPGPGPQEQLYAITHVPSGSALGSLPICGEAFAREALEKIASLAERFPGHIEWGEERPFASEEIARLAGQLIHWIVVDAYARGKLAARRRSAGVSLPNQVPPVGGHSKQAAHPAQHTTGP